VYLRYDIIASHIGHMLRQFDLID